MSLSPDGWALRKIARHTTGHPEQIVHMVPGSSVYAPREVLPPGQNDALPDSHTEQGRDACWLAQTLAVPVASVLSQNDCHHNSYRDTTECPHSRF